MLSKYGLLPTLVSLLLSSTSTEATGGRKPNEFSADIILQSQSRVVDTPKSSTSPTELMKIKKEIGSSTQGQRRPSLDFHVTQLVREEDNSVGIYSGPIQQYHNHIQASTPAKHPARLFDIRPVDDHPGNAADVERFLSQAKEAGKIGGEEHAALTHVVREKAKAVRHVEGGGVVQSATGAVVYLPGMNHAHALRIAKKKTTGKLRVIGAKDKYPRIQYEPAPEGWHDINKQIVASMEKLPSPVQRQDEPILITDSPPHRSSPATALGNSPPRRSSPQVDAQQPATSPDSEATTKHVKSKSAHAAEHTPSPQPVRDQHPSAQPPPATSVENGKAPARDAPTSVPFQSAGLASRASPPRRPPSFAPASQPYSSPSQPPTAAHANLKQRSPPTLRYHVTKAELQQGRVYIRQGSLLNYHRELEKKLAPTHPIRLYNIHPADHHPDNAADFRSRLVQKKQKNEISQEDYDVHVHNAAEQLKATMHIDGGGVVHSLDDELIHLPGMDRHHVHNMHQKEQTSRLGLLKPTDGEAVRRLKFTLPGKRRERPREEPSMQAVSPPRPAKINVSPALRTSNGNAGEPPSFTSKVTRYHHDTNELSVHNAVDHRRLIEENLPPSHLEHMLGIHPMHDHRYNLPNKRQKLDEAKRSKKIDEYEYKLEMHNAEMKARLLDEVDRGGYARGSMGEMHHHSLLDPKVVYEKLSRGSGRGLHKMRLQHNGKTVYRLKWAEGASTVRITQPQQSTVAQQVTSRQPEHTSSTMNLETHPHLFSEPLRPALRQATSQRRGEQGAATVARKPPIQFAPGTKQGDGEVMGAGVRRLWEPGSRSLGGRNRGRGRGRDRGRGRGRTAVQSRTEGRSNTSNVVRPTTPDASNPPRH